MVVDPSVRQAVAGLPSIANLHARHLDGRLQPMSHHKGLVWSHDNALCTAELMRYGFVEDARRIAVARVWSAGIRTFPRDRPEIWQKGAQLTGQGLRRLGDRPGRSARSRSGQRILGLRSEGADKIGCGRQVVESRWTRCSAGDAVTTREGRRAQAGRRASAGSGITVIPCAGDRPGGEIAALSRRFPPPPPEEEPASCTHPASGRSTSPAQDTHASTRNTLAACLSRVTLRGRLGTVTKRSARPQALDGRAGEAVIPECAGRHARACSRVTSVLAAAVEASGASAGARMRWEERVSGR